MVLNPWGYRAIISEYVYGFVNGTDCCKCGDSNTQPCFQQSPAYNPLFRTKFACEECLENEFDFTGYVEV